MYGYKTTAREKQVKETVPTGSRIGFSLQQVLITYNKCKQNTEGEVVTRAKLNNLRIKSAKSKDRKPGHPRGKQA